MLFLLANNERRSGTNRQQLGIYNKKSDSGCNYFLKFILYSFNRQERTFLEKKTDYRDGWAKRENDVYICSALHNMGTCLYKAWLTGTTVRMVLQ